MTFALFFKFVWGLAYKESFFELIIYVSNLLGYETIAFIELLYFCLSMSFIRNQKFFKNKMAPKFADPLSFVC